MRRIYSSNRIRDRDKAKQLVNFSGITLGDGIFPTDIDGLIEYRNSLYIIFEIKYRNPYLPTGQMIALERIADDLTKTGKEVIVFVATHNVWNAQKDVQAELCDVQRYYHGGLKKWVNLGTCGLKLGDAVKQFKSDPKKFVEEHTGGLQKQVAQEKTVNEQFGNSAERNSYMS